MKFSVGAAVYCQNSYCGQTRYLILNSSTWRLTHLAIKLDNLPVPNTQLMRLTPLQYVTEGKSRTVRLSCTIDTLAGCEPFFRTSYIKQSILSDEMIDSPAWTSLDLEDQPELPKERDPLPPGVVAIGRDTQVEAGDGHVGSFEQLIVNSDDYLITHLCFRRGHLWELEIVTISVTAVSGIEANTIYLKLDKAEVNRLPSTSARA